MFPREVCLSKGDIVLLKIACISEGTPGNDIKIVPSKFARTLGVVPMGFGIGCVFSGVVAIFICGCVSSVLLVPVFVA